MDPGGRVAQAFRPAGLTMSADRAQNAYMADAAFIRRISVDSSTDPRTVKRYLASERVSPLARERIEFALIDRGLRSHLRAPVAIDVSPKTRA
jgi:hypothetical protein